MPQEDRVIVFNDSSDKSLYLLDYLKENGYNPKVIDVNVASSLKERFDSIQPEGYKVFLSLSYEDLLENNEEARRFLNSLDSTGWRNLIVLPFEGMDNRTIALRCRDLGLGSNKNEVKTMVKPYIEVAGEPFDGTKKFIVKEDEVIENDTKEGTEREVSDVQKKKQRGVST